MEGDGRTLSREKKANASSHRPQIPVLNAHPGQKSRRTDNRTRSLAGNQRWGPLNRFPVMQGDSPDTKNGDFYARGAPKTACLEGRATGHYKRVEQRPARCSRWTARTCAKRREKVRDELERPEGREDEPYRRTREAPLVLTKGGARSKGGDQK